MFNSGFRLQPNERFSSRRHTRMIGCRRLENFPTEDVSCELQNSFCFFRHQACRCFASGVSLHPFVFGSFYCFLLLPSMNCSSVSLLRHLWVSVLLAVPCFVSSPFLDVVFSLVGAMMREVEDVVVVLMVAKPSPRVKNLVWTTAAPSFAFQLCKL